MRKIKICDVTLRQNDKNKEMSFKNKLEAAKRLEELNVDIIEVGPIVNDQADTILIKTMCSFIKNATISCVTVANKEAIDKAYNAIKIADKKRLAIIFPASSTQMEYMSHMKAPKMLETIKEIVSYAHSLNNEVEAIFVDATRSDDDFLNEAIKTAILNGASNITVEDSAGIMFPIEFRSWIEELFKTIPELSNANLGVTCNDELSMGVASAFGAVKMGANTIKTCAFAGVVPSLDKIVQTFRAIGSKIEIDMNIDVTNLFKNIQAITNEAIKETPRISVKSDEYLEAHISESELGEIIQKGGYELTPEDMGKVYETFQRVAVKKQVSLKELDVIIANTALQVPATYKLDNYVINSGNKIFSTASIVLIKNGETLYGLSRGDGPIDASFLAIENIIGHHFELDDFQVQAATEGREAIGEALVKLRYNGKLYSGRGISTDIIGASIRAYVAALNKITYEENSL